MIARGIPLVLLLAGCASTTTPEPEGRRPARLQQPQPSASACAHDSARLRMLLRRPHHAPRLTEVEQLCNDALPALQAVAGDARGFGVERLRAIELLGSRRGAAPDLLNRLAVSARELASIRRAALVALTRSAPSDLSVTTATRALSDADPHVRVAAAEALGRIDAPTARTALATARKTEKELFVQRALARALDGRSD